MSKRNLPTFYFVLIWGYLLKNKKHKKKTTNIWMTDSASDYMVLVSTM